MVPGKGYYTIDRELFAGLGRDKLIVNEASGNKERRVIQLVGIEINRISVKLRLCAIIQ